MKFAKKNTLHANTLGFKIYFGLNVLVICTYDTSKRKITRFCVLFNTGELETN